ncbi:thiosulfate oxidation carrier complex protein SoxZ [Massilia sp. P8910]|uniref:thiosulfate oxidation carrier complex protein SoxZ n=1 Tax=Massilia antarctica TaxID=2765360 RepID=UPI0006BB55AC|nr:thiosulfate oxidation carrier complex protein SoxZ [Massilia antarctica]MCE3604279.1 thiosulfate oxidation carrier complex protein SoxZ [Massilia antarctica]CUI03245.1 Sulfur oxidation protein SoxZ [Janthinobacterium sp. CG23_2]CUU27031.1 Sulfur oxidation protein SoxZ [Janthinobacterium sp. CG23_2]
MADPMRIRASATGELVEVKILMRHDMETGQRKDAAGKLVPAHFIKTLVAKVGEKVVFDANFGPSVSKDPFLSFKFKGAAKGDKVTVTWVDTVGDTRTDEGTIT